MNKTVAIIGSSGLVGGYLFRLLTINNDRWKVIQTSRSVKGKGVYPLDIADAVGLRDFFLQYPCDVVIFTAAMTHVDRCEKEKELCFKTNVEPIKNSIRFLKEQGHSFRFVFFSSEYIFDGTKGPYRESDSANPLSVYGMSKWMAEEFIRKEVRNHLIVRITGVYGLEEAEKNFFYTVQRYLTQKKFIRVPNDQISSPTYAGFVAKAVLAWLEQGMKGTYHAANDSLVRRSDFAVMIADRFGWDSQWIQPIPTAQLGQKAKRPLNAGLVPSSVPGLSRVPTLKESLQEFHQEWEKYHHDTEQRESS